MTAVAVDSLREAVRLHLAPLGPRQRALVAEGRADRDAVAAWQAVTQAQVDDELARAASAGATIVTRGDPRWPPLLGEMPDAPHALWVRGTLPPIEPLAIAGVGPRRPSPYGLSLACTLAEDLARLGAVVVSGGAKGVDAAAHRAALAAGGATVAVLGCGVDVTYPPQHGPLYADIARGGAVVSELPCRTPPLPGHFPVRNRILAGWSRAVLVVEATFKSGSLITARLGIEMNRDVFAVPGPVTSRLSEGTNELLGRGAHLLRGVMDVLAQLRPDERARLHPLTGAAGTAGAPDDAVLAALRPGEARAVDELAAATGLPAGELLSRLVTHEAAGRVAALHGGLWMRTGRGR